MEGVGYEERWEGRSLKSKFDRIDYSPDRQLFTQLGLVHALRPLVTHLPLLPSHPTSPDRPNQVFSKSSQPLLRHFPALVICPLRHLALSP